MMSRCGSINQVYLGTTVISNLAQCVRLIPFLSINPFMKSRGYESITFMLCLLILCNGNRSLSNTADENAIHVNRGVMAGCGIALLIHLSYAIYDLFLANTNSSSLSPYGSESTAASAITELGATVIFSLGIFGISHVTNNCGRLRLPWEPQGRDPQENVLQV